MNSENEDSEEPSASTEVGNATNLCENTKDLSISNFVWADECSSETEEEPEVVDSRRVITRDKLYEDPNPVPEVEVIPEVPDIPILPKHKAKSKRPKPLYSEGYDWTRRNWSRGGTLDETPTNSGFNTRPLSLGTVVRLLQRNLDKALSKPVDMSKAEGMMQKMGWQGGGLGKQGQGILEPIAPNAAYANTNIGFGQDSRMPRKKRPRKMPQQPQMPQAQQLTRKARKTARLNAAKKSKETLRTNILNVVLEFVKNNQEIELLFDKKFYPNERKIIHTMVHEVINAEDDTQRVKFGVQESLLKLIYEHNCYILGTESEGERPNRQLRIYKEAPPNIYLVTPDDLTKPELGLQGNETASDLDSFNDEMKSIFIEIRDMFVEFTKETEYNQFRFLGQFCVLQMSCVNVFLNMVQQCLNNNYDGLDNVIVDVFSRDLVYELTEDVNGSPFIQKRTAETKVTII